jgi:hypothetical protein
MQTAQDIAGENLGLVPLFLGCHVPVRFSELRLRDTAPVRSASPAQRSVAVAVIVIANNKFRQRSRNRRQSRIFLGMRPAHHFIVAIIVEPGIESNSDIGDSLRRFLSVCHRPWSYDVDAVLELRLRSPRYSTRHSFVFVIVAVGRWAMRE